MGRKKKITFTKDELNSIGNNLNELIPQTIKPLEEDIRKIERDMRQISSNLIYIDGLLQAIIDIQENLINSSQE